MIDCERQLGENRRNRRAMPGPIDLWALAKPGRKTEFGWRWRAPPDRWAGPNRKGWERLMAFNLYQRSSIMTYLTADISPARQARGAPWCQSTTSGPQRCGRVKDRGPRWAKSAHRGRCGARPMRRHRASRRACPDDPICSHEMSHYRRALVLLAGLALREIRWARALKSPYCERPPSNTRNLRWPLPAMALGISLAKDGAWGCDR